MYVYLYISIYTHKYTTLYVCVYINTYFLHLLYITNQSHDPAKPFAIWQPSSSWPQLLWSHHLRKPLSSTPTRLPLNSATFLNWLCH